VPKTAPLHGAQARRPNKKGNVTSEFVPMPKSSPPDSPSGQLDFEGALKRLEQIVHKLEEGDIGLNEALKQYEEGVKLLRQSYELLERAERRIELLSGVDAEGNPITQPFDDTATIDQDEPGKRRTRRRSAPEKSHQSGGGNPLFGDANIDET
jgi:exodeoxyribonuclease VII small subunit